MSTAERLESLRAALRAENISYSELYELQGYGEEGLIDPGDVELLEAAGVPEFPDEPWCNHDAPAIVNGVCECGERVS